MKTIEERAWKKEAQINHDTICEACKVYRNELQRLKTLLDESVGIPANLVSVDKSLSGIAKEMLYEDN